MSISRVLPSRRDCTTPACSARGASRLSAMAEILGVPISYFFGDLQPDDADLSAEDRQWREQLQRPETIEFIRLYYAISDQKIRRQFLEMAKTVAESYAARSG